jgi:hypothetical protein
MGWSFGRVPCDCALKFFLAYQSPLFQTKSNCSEVALNNVTLKEKEIFLYDLENHVHIHSTHSPLERLVSLHVSENRHGFVDWCLVDLLLQPTSASSLLLTEVLYSCFSPRERYPQCQKFTKKSYGRTIPESEMLSVSA